MEKLFISIFILALIVYAILSAGLFLLLLKVLLMFNPEIHLLGLTIY